MRTRNKITFAVSAFMLLLSVAVAQDPNTTMTLVCKTTDGNIIVTPEYIALKDYKFTLERTLETGVISLVDRKSNTTAVLDARGEDGLYLAVNEKGTTMQVVAARAGIEIYNEDSGSHPETPAFTEKKDRDFIGFVFGHNLAANYR